MSAFQVVEVKEGEFTDALLDGVATVLTRLYAELPGDEPAATAEWARTHKHFGGEAYRHRRIVALHGDRVVGLGDVGLERGENAHIAEFQVSVDPACRRQGIGTAIVDAGLDIAEQEGRTSLVPWGIRSVASRAFWKSLDLPEVAVDQMSRLDLRTVDRELMKQWRTTASAREAGYELKPWITPCPDALMPALVVASAGMQDAPMGDVEMAQTEMDESWHRAIEGAYLRRGARAHGIVAVAPDGSPAAMTEIIVFDQRRWFGMQQGTATLRDHRNQGLGRWVKAAMFEHLVSDCPELTTIETGNADDNDAMKKINAEMGFQPHVQLTTRQADIAVVRAALARRDISP